jgi:peptide/nickel transport system ATP-binding protein
MSAGIDAAAGTEAFLKVSHVTQRFRVPGGMLEAVSDVSLEINRGQSVGLVGESGSGKSTLGRAILQLPPPTEGSVRFDGQELVGMSRKEMQSRRRLMQLIFQDPISALNPRRKVRDLVAEGLVIAGESKEDTRQQVDRMLRQVGLEPEVVGNVHAHELSGGQCQRIAIARALVVQPQLLICDEPVASLDVSVQGQVLNLLEDMRQRLDLSMLFISHNLAVIHVVSDQVGVMYLGKIVEFGTSDQVAQKPAHPYTQGLLDAVPDTDTKAKSTDTTLRGEIPSPLNPPSGCRFRTRCPFAQDRCAAEVPVMREVAPGQLVACHFPLHGEVAPPSPALKTPERV